MCNAVKHMKPVRYFHMSTGSLISASSWKTNCQLLETTCTSAPKSQCLPHEVTVETWIFKKYLWSATSSMFHTSSVPAHVLFQTSRLKFTEFSVLIIHELWICGRYFCSDQALNTEPLQTRDSQKEEHGRKDPIWPKYTWMSLFYKLLRNYVNY